MRNLVPTFAYSIIAIACLSLVFSCAQRPTKTRPPKVLDDNSTVYGETGRTSDNDSAGSDREVVEDSEIYTEDRGSISGELIDAGHQEVALNLNWEPVYFEFDQSDLTEMAKLRLQEYAATLKANPNLSVLLEGHCDMRGTEEYNLGLGERRAHAVKRFLIELGLNPAQLQTISYGELRPALLEESERAFSLNRRVSFTF